LNDVGFSINPNHTKIKKKKLRKNVIINFANQNLLSLLLICMCTSCKLNSNNYVNQKQPTTLKLKKILNINYILCFPIVPSIWGPQWNVGMSDVAKACSRSVKKRTVWRSCDAQNDSSTLFLLTYLTSLVTYLLTYSLIYLLID
jgi:hypothetical protein